MWARNLFNWKSFFVLFVTFRAPFFSSQFQYSLTVCSSRFLHFIYSISLVQLFPRACKLLGSGSSRLSTHMRSGARDYFQLPRDAWQIPKIFPFVNIEKQILSFFFPRCSRFIGSVPSNNPSSGFFPWNNLVFISRLFPRPPHLWQNFSLLSFSGGKFVVFLQDLWH